MSELELGQATIVYEDPDEGKKEVTVKNEQVAYVRDHWAVKAGTDDQGNDLMKQIPATRVHYVERNVQQFEEEINTVRHRVESLAGELRQKIPVDLGQGGSQQGGQPRGESPTQVQTDSSAQSGGGSQSGSSSGSGSQSDSSSGSQSGSSSGSGSQSDSSSGSGS